MFFHIPLFSHSPISHPHRIRGVLGGGGFGGGSSSQPSDGPGGGRDYGFDDPVGPVPLDRWDVEGGGGGGGGDGHHRRASADAMRFAAFLPGVERFDAQVYMEGV